MYRWLEEHNKQRLGSVGVCVIAGSGFGLGLGILLGFSLDNIAYVLIGVVYGAMMGLAIGESNKDFKDYPTS
ncbi:MAG: hypothetical protein A2Z14_00495 [Chloroflexi bacterium RBG_16_48_8]|nr:MAG: hypothetical protein A2Z14_00495 [Chloroflexi bacterium RBG_16_48_8]